VEKKNLLLQPGIEPRFLCRPARAAPGPNHSAIFISRMSDLLLRTVAAGTEIPIDYFSNRIIVVCSLLLS
jgi:hypothetical protein